MTPTDTNACLNWDVFVTPGIPIVTRDKPPDVRETYFQAMAATLIYGARDAVLVDAFMTVTQANALADWVAARDRNLKTIYITHGHGDHWFGVATLLERFPNAKAVATPNAVRVMRQNASQKRSRGAGRRHSQARFRTDWSSSPTNSRDTSSISRDMTWSQWNWVIPTPTTRPVYTSLPSDSWLRGMPPTMTSTSTSPNQMRRHGRSGSQRSTRSSR